MNNSYYDKLNNKQKSRWMAMLTAIDLVDSKCRQNNIRFDNIDLSPIPIKHYINNRAKQIEKDLNEEDNRDKNNKIMQDLYLKMFSKIVKKA